MVNNNSITAGDNILSHSHINDVANKSQATYFRGITNEKDSFSDNVDKSKEKKQKRKKSRKLSTLGLALLSPIPHFRRLHSVPDNVEEGNLIRPIGLLAFMFMNVPEDARDVKAAIGQLKGNTRFTKDEYKYLQHKFSFFRGTLLEPLLKFEKGKWAKFSEYLARQDVTLYDTKFGNFVRKIFKVDPINKRRFKTHNRINVREGRLRSFILKGKNYKQLINRTLLRIPKLTVLFLGAIELPAIIKSFVKKDKEESRVSKGFKQLAKSIVNLVSIVGAIGVGGAIFASRGKLRGPLGSLVGMGIGAVAGSAASRGFSNLIDRKKSPKEEA